MDAATTDGELIDACKRGDHTAFGQIVERYQRAVFAVSLSGTGNRAMAEDVAQDTFVTAWKQLDALREIERLPSWLCGIARNVAQRARKRRDRETSMDDRDIAGSETAFDAVSDREADSIVTDALAKVPDTYRDPLVLFYCEGQSVKDVARALGISEDATHQRLSRGRQFLAAGVTTLVEKSLASARPRKNLVAAVVGVVALGSAHHAEAATVLQKGSGSTMVKIGAAVIGIAAVAFGVKYVVAAHSSPDGHGGFHAHGSTSPTASSATNGSGRMTPATEWIKQQRDRMKHVGPTAPAAATTETTPVPSCTETANRYADLIIEAHGGSDTLHAKQDFRAGLVDSFDKTCMDTPWSPAYRRCITDAVSPFSLIGCRLATGTPTPVDVPAPVIDRATIGDTGCTAVANHVIVLLTPTAESLGDIPEGGRAQILKTVEENKPQMIEELIAVCTDDEWPEPTRACLVSATMLPQLETCH